MSFIETLKEADVSLFLWLNSHHTPFFDFVMYHITRTQTWIPLHLLLVYLLYRKFDKKAVWAVVAVVATIVAADQISVLGFKEVFCRLRPCHNEAIASAVHLVRNHCGGMYGFVSSHAANTFALATIARLLLHNKIVSNMLLLWAILVSYTRIYLGVHYPADVLCGALLGIVIARLLYAGLLRTKLLHPMIPTTQTPANEVQ